jgi:hypothetical protein
MSVQGTHSNVASAGHATARHRAHRAPGLVPPVRPVRHAHLDRRRRLALMRWAAVLLAVCLLPAAAVGWRLVDDRGPGGNAVVTSPEPSAGTRVGVAIDAHGNVQVSVDVVRSSTSGTPTLSVPNRPGTGFLPQVRIGSLLADSVPVPVEETLGSGAVLGVPEGAAATHLRVDYTATGTYVASRPAPPGRGLVLLTPVRLDGPGRLVVTDPRIRNLECVSDAGPRVCGHQDGDTWSVEGLAEGEDVVAQVDLA